MAELDMRMPVVLSHGIPDSTTPGWVGLLAMDVTQTSKPLYKCTAADNQKKVYAWKPIESGGGGSGGGGDYILTDADKAEIAIAVSEIIEIPAKTSELTNDSGFVTRISDDLENYYTKDKSYSRTEIDEKISVIPKFSIEVVSELPTSDISSTTVYLVGGGLGSDLYVEYIYVNGAWEILGAQRVDLTGYAKETWVNAKIADFLTADKLTAAMVTGALGFTPAKATDVPAVDSTLKVSGAAADAKAVGDKVNQLSNEIADLGAVPDGVISEASATVDKAMSRNGNRILRFLVSSDAHQDNDNTLVTKGNIELGRAHSEILKLIGADFIANLGDVSWSSYDNTTEEVVEQIKAFNRFMGAAVKGETLLYMEGNHDDANYSITDNDGDGVTSSTYKLSQNAVHTLIWSHNKDGVRDTDHLIDGYCYKDFEDLKVRVIVLNTEQGTGDGGFIEGYQIKWFAETALDMTDKTDWSVITLAHHPLDWGHGSLFKDCVNTVNAFINGDNFSYTTTDGTAIAVDYTDKNCQYVGHFHGHTHAFCVVRMQKFVNPEDGDYYYEDVDAWQIGVPNACYSRNNTNLGSTNERTARFSTPTTYNKSDEDGKRTSFNLVSVCLDEKIIYADNYGAGIDREISYEFPDVVVPTYTNQIPISTDASGAVYNGVGYKENTYFSAGSEGTRSGVSATGFMPIGCGSANTSRGEQVIYLENIDALPTDTNVRINFYTADKTYIGQVAGINLKSEENDGGGVECVYTLGTDGYINKIDVTGLTSYYRNSGTGETAFFRICSPGIDGESIITVNEPIT